MDNHIGNWSVKFDFKNKLKHITIDNITYTVSSLQYIRHIPDSAYRIKHLGTDDEPVYSCEIHWEYTRFVDFLKGQRSNLPKRKCDCGGAVVGVPHYDWCATRRKQLSESRPGREL